MQPINWGILGTGFIAQKFAQALITLPDTQLMAIGSRHKPKARKFGQEFKVPRQYPSYQELVHDPDIDVVYIATPHPLHYHNSLICLQNGKAVLCEKPFTMNAAEARELISLARQQDLFLMEAMWVRFLPLLQKIKAFIQAGKIGVVRFIQSDFGYRFPWQPHHRALNPELGGGGLLDVGIYPISLTSLIMEQAPQKILSKAHIGDTGVDEQSAMLFYYDRGQMASLSCAVRTRTAQHSYIYGTRGYIHIHGPWWQLKKAVLVIDDDEQIITEPFRGNGYQYQIIEVNQCLRKGNLESGTMSLDESLTIMETMDRIRQQWGLKYPME